MAGFSLDINITQADIADHLKITQQTYSSYETGKRQMSFDTLCLLADFYEISTDYLLGRHDVMPSFLSDEERMIVSQYRLLENYAKDTIKNSLTFEYARSIKREKIKKR